MRGCPLCRSPLRGGVDLAEPDDDRKTGFAHLEILRHASPAQDDVGCRRWLGTWSWRNGAVTHTHRMWDDRELSSQTRQALLWAALVADCAGETFMTTSRIAASLLRTPSARVFLERAQLDPVRLLAAVDDPRFPSFDECADRVSAELEASGIRLGSPEHLRNVRHRPLDRPALGVLGSMIETDGHVSGAPLRLLARLIHSENALAERLAKAGLTADRISADLDSHP